MSEFHFPILLSYEGDDEAELITNPQQLDLLLQQPQHLLPDTDRLIDSQGQVFVFKPSGQLHKTSQQLELPAVIRLIQQHFFAQAQSCIVKIQPPDIRSALLLLADEPAALRSSQDEHK